MARDALSVLDGHQVAAAHIAGASLGGGALLPVLDDERRLRVARRARVVAEGRRLADIAELYVATAADWRDVKS